MPKLRNGNKRDSNPGSLDCKSGILPLIYSAPQQSIRKVYERNKPSAQIFISVSGHVDVDWEFPFQSQITGCKPDH